MTQISEEVSEIVVKCPLPLEFVPATGANYAAVAQNHRPPHEAFGLEDVVVANFESRRAASHFKHVVVADNHDGYDAIIGL